MIRLTILLLLLFPISFKAICQLKFNEIQRFLFTNNFDTVESFLLKKGYDFETSKNYKEGNIETTSYYFKRIDKIVNSEEMIILYKELNSPVAVTFTKAVLVTRNKDLFYDLKSQLPSTSVLQNESTESSCLKRTYSIGILSCYLNICNENGDNGAIDYLVGIMWPR